MYLKYKKPGHAKPIHLQNYKTKKGWSSEGAGKGAGAFREILAVLASKTTGWQYFCTSLHILKIKLSF